MTFQFLDLLFSLIFACRLQRCKSFAWVRRITKELITLFKRAFVRYSTTLIAQTMHVVIFKLWFYRREVCYTDKIKPLNNKPYCDIKIDYCLSLLLKYKLRNLKEERLLLNNEMKIRYNWHCRSEFLNCNIFFRESFPKEQKSSASTGK